MSTALRDETLRLSGNPHAAIPEVQLLSNGRYHVMVTSAGGGYSRWKDLAVTRWREDGTCDNWGAFCYIRDVADGDVWSTAHQPTLRAADTSAVVFAPGLASFRRRDHDIEVQTEIVVAPDDDVELRRVRITNGSSRRRVLDVTSYSEIVLAPPATDAAHPAFSKLFIETELLRERQAILCSRRPRAPGEPRPWMFHLLTATAPAAGDVSYETDRMRFIGRGRTTADPQALDEHATLSGSAGPVLDPVAALRCRITLDPGDTAVVDLISGVSATREACVGLIGKYQDRQIADRVLAATPARGQATLSSLHTSDADARLYLRLAGSVLFANASLRANPSILSKNRQGQSSLWAYSISGDRPIVLLRIADPANIALARQLLEAHTYWRQHGLAVDLVIVSEARDGRGPALVDEITKLVAAGGSAGRINQPGGIFVRLSDTVPDADSVLLQTVARIVISDADGTLEQQLERRCVTPTAIAPPPASRGS